MCWAQRLRGATATTWVALAQRDGLEHGLIWIGSKNLSKKGLTGGQGGIRNSARNADVYLDLCEGESASIHLSMHRLG
jgi:hypothetical protein